ncbi:MAG TPA: Gfo/Idh/MocA family oxidoreductase [Candidatus Limnocylindrales bacterium]|nr:Gfo/Idh/MocA family oxidoreductase [Candidatus Limnocylindrales bacterium]
MTVLGWGVIGPGRIAPRIARALAASTRGRLVAAASRDIVRARSYLDANGIRDGRAYGSYEELLADPRVDVVYVALPNHLHAAWSVRALEAGKHVLCEKPLALSVAEVDAIAAAAAAAGRLAVEAFMYLHHPQIRRAIELATSGALGPLELVRGSFSFVLTHPNDPRIDPAMGGGSLWDVGCYPVAFARRIAGAEPDRLTAEGRFDERGVDRTFAGQLHFPARPAFPGGLLAQIDSSFAEPDRQSLEIVGQGAVMRLSAPFLSAPDGPLPSLTIDRDGTAETIEVPTVDQVAMEVEDLHAAILRGSPPAIDLAFSRGTIATLVALDAAARTAAGVAPLTPA